MSTAETRLARRVRIAKDLAEAIALADAVLERARAAKVRTAPKRQASRDKRRNEEEAKRAQTAWIRERCVIRANGVGELCGRTFAPDEPAEMCHLDGGSGKRRQMQSTDNCLMEHHYCHQGPHGFDRRPLLWLPEVKRWAERNGYPLPERFRKLEALAEAKHPQRRAAP